MKDPWSVKQLVLATQQLHESRLYQRFTDHDFFLLRTPKLNHPAVAVLMGHGGDAFGLSTFLGPSAMTSYNTLVNTKGGAMVDRALRQSTMIGYQMSDVMNLSHDARRWLKKANIRPDSDLVYPDPLSFQPGKVPEIFLKDNNTRLLLHLVRGVLSASKDKAFKPCGVDRRGRVLCVQLDMDMENPKATVGWEAHADLKQSEPGPSAALRQPNDTSTNMPVSARFDLSDLNTNDDSWLVCMMTVPGSVRGDDRQPYMLVVCSEQHAGIWPTLLMGDEPTEMIDALARLMRGEHESPGDEVDDLFFGLIPPPTGLPARLILDSKSLHDAACQAFEPLNIECINGENNPALQAMLEDIYDAFDADMFDNREEDIAYGPPPKADDLDGWKLVDRWLKDTIHEGFDRDRRYHGARALKRYFGPDADHRKLFTHFRRLMIIDSYAHWFATSYRSSRNRPTLAEQWLDDPQTPDALKVLLKAILAHGPSLYRVSDANEDEGKLTFTDLFTGEITIVTDFALSTCLDPGLVIPAKLVPVGDFHFFFPTGPVLNSSRFSRVLAHFDQQQIVPSPEQFREHPHQLGRLWHVIHQVEERGLDLRNADGHVLAYHKAVFSCPDRAALQRFLAGEPEFEPEPDDPNTWVWFRPNTEMKPGAGTHVFETHHESSNGPVTLLGQIAYEQGRLKLTVNSSERLDALRAMLEQIEGVEFLSVESQPITQPTESEPAPDESDDPIDLNEDEMEAAQAYLNQHYRQWLDMPIPALGDKTPRQAAKSPKLRQKLAVMIRAMPDPTNDRIQISAPREMMLAELGLD